MAKTISINGKNYKEGSKRANEAVAAGGKVSTKASDIRANADASKARTSARGSNDYAGNPLDSYGTRENPGVFSTATSSPTITSANISPTPQIQLPSPPLPSDLGTSAITAVSGLATDSQTKAAQDAATSAVTVPGQKEADKSFKDYLKSIVAPAKTEDIYKKTEREVGLQEKQQAVANYTSQLNAIVNKANADKLALVGQGRGVPEVIIGGQQAKIDREAAIQSLPIATQLAAAQGDLELAQSHLDTLFRIRADDAQRQADYKNKVAEAVYNYASDKQKLLIDERRRLDDRAYQEQRDTLNFARDLASTAIQNGQPSVAAAIMGLDPRSSTYAQDIAAYSSRIYVPQKGSGGGTESERLQNSLSTINRVIVPFAETPTGLTILNPDGDYINPAAWKELITEAQGIGVSRKAFIENFGNRLYIDPENDDKPSKAYGLTPAELKDLGYE